MVREVALDELIGLALPFGTISILDLFNDKILRRKDIADGTAVTILGEVSNTHHGQNWCQAQFLTPVGVACE